MNPKLSELGRVIFGKVVQIIDDVQSPYVVVKVKTQPYGRKNSITVNMKNWKGEKPLLENQYVAIKEDSIKPNAKEGLLLGYRASMFRPLKGKIEKELAREVLSEKGTNIIDCGILKTNTPFWIRESRKSAPDVSKGGGHFVIHNPIDDPHDGVHDTRVIHTTTQEEVAELTGIGIRTAYTIRTSPHFAFALTGKGDRTRPHFHGHFMLMKTSDLPSIVALPEILSGEPRRLRPTACHMTGSGIHHVISPPGQISALSDFIESFIVTYNSTKNSSNWDDRLEKNRWRIIGFCSVKDDGRVAWHIHQIWPREGDQLPRLVDPFVMW